MFTIFGRAERGVLAVSAVPGCVAVLAVFWLAAESYGGRVALVALGLMALSRWPLILSRHSNLTTALVALSTTAAAAALAASRTGRVAFGLLAGLCIGLLPSTHASAPVVVAAFSLFALLVMRPQGRGRLVAVAAIGAIGTLLPPAIGIVRQPSLLGGHLKDMHFFTPVKEISLPAGSGFWPSGLRPGEAAFEYAGVLLFTRDPGTRHVIPGRAAVSWLLGAATLVGTAVGLRRAAKGSRAELLLVLLIGAGFLSGVLSNPTTAPNTTRICAALGPLCVLGALSVVGWTEALSRRIRVRPGVLAAGVLAVVFVAETMPALCVWPEDPLVRRAFFTSETEAGRLLRSLGGHAFLDPGAVTHPLVVEALVGGPDAGVPLMRLPRLAPSELVARLPGGPFWYVTTSAGLARLRGPFRVSRGIRVDSDARDVVVVRLAPDLVPEPLDVPGLRKADS